MPITIFLADDHPIIREGVRNLLRLEPDFEVVGESGDGVKALEMVRQLDPDILLLDLRMPNMDGFTFLEALRHLNQHTRVIVLTASEDKEDFVRAMTLGSMGIVRKQAAVIMLTKSIRKVHGGEVWLDSITTSCVINRLHNGRVKGGKVKSISDREKEVIVLVAEGYKNKEVAEKMLITERTVKHHLQNIFGKLDVADRHELVLCAIQKGLYVPPTII